MAKQVTKAAVRAFRQKVWRYFRRHGRRLPWRENLDPYAIVVSEIMLQQTQVDRVLPKYEQFLKAFPDFTSLARSSLREVLTVWQGLGYNRRAFLLRKAAKIVWREYDGQLPRAVEELHQLPGLGPYTAKAVAVFAYNQPQVLIETNIRTVFIHEFFPGRSNIHDAQVLPLVAATVSKQRSRRWYWALMDYGAHLKKKHPNPSRRSQHYHPSQPFRDSNRQIRGAIIKTLLTRSSLSYASLQKNLPYAERRLKENLEKLIRENLVAEKNNHYFVKS